MSQDFTPKRYGPGWEIRQSENQDRGLVVRWAQTSQKTEVGRNGSGVGGINPIRDLTTTEAVWLAGAVQAMELHRSGNHV